MAERRFAVKPKSVDLVQGDVFLSRIDSIPDRAERVNQRPLALGEATGHSHRIEEDVEMYELDGILYIRTDRTVQLVHEEHRPITVEPGCWQVGIVREYDWFDAQVRQIED